MKRVAIGSRNPVKINCVKKAFRKYLPKVKFEFIAQSVPSGVEDQPMSDRECILGAKNRAKRVLQKLKADYGVGIEGGIIKIDGQYFARAWVAIVNNKGVIGLSSSLSAPMPPKFMKLINNGMELGKANDMITGGKNTKHKEGYFGFISDSIITRKKGYIDAVVMALARFKKSNLFMEKEKITYENRKKKPPKLPKKTR